MGFFTFLLIIAFLTGYFLGIMNNYLQSFLSAQFLYKPLLSFSSLSLIPITYNFVCVVMFFFFFFPKCITLYSLVLKFNCNLITLSFSIVSFFCESLKSAQNWLFWIGFCYLFLSVNHLWICWAEQTLGQILEELPW